MYVGILIKRKIMNIIKERQNTFSNRHKQPEKYIMTTWEYFLLFMLFKHKQSQQTHLKNSMK